MNYSTISKLIEEQIASLFDELRLRHTSKTDHFE